MQDATENTDHSLAQGVPPLVIEVEDLITHYGEREILKGVPMAVREGEIMVIMGGSGSGK